MIALARLHWIRRQGMVAATLFWGLALRSVLGAWQNRKMPAVPLALWTAGMLSNALVILANGGRMPTTAPWSRHPWCGQDCDHPKRLLWLGDRWRLRLGRREAWVSVGDALLVAGGLAMVVVSAYRAVRPKATPLPAPSATGTYPAGTVDWECKGCGTPLACGKGSFMDRVRWCFKCLDKNGIDVAARVDGTWDLDRIERDVRALEVRLAEGI